MDERQAARERLEEARRTSSRRRAELEEAQKRVQQAAVFGSAAKVERAQEALERAQGAYDAAAIVEDELLLKHVEILHDETSRENPPRLTGRYFRERYTGERYKVTQLRGERLKVTEPVVEEFLGDQEAWEKEFKSSDRELRRQSEGVKRSKQDKREREAAEKKAERERKKAAAAEKKAKKAAEKATKAKQRSDKPKAAKAGAKPAKAKPKAAATVPVKRGQTAVRATLYQLEPTKKVPEQEAGVVLRIRYQGRPVLVGLPVEHVKVAELVVHPELGELRSQKGGGLTAVVGPRYQVSLASDGVTLDGSWPYESAAVAAVQAANSEAGPVDWEKVRVIEGRVRWSSSQAEAKAKAWMAALQGAKPKAVVVTRQELVGTAPKEDKAKVPKKPKSRPKTPKSPAAKKAKKEKAPKDKAPERAERPDDEDAEMMAEFRELLAQPGVLDVVKAAAAGAEPEHKTRRQANPGAT